MCRNTLLVEQTVPELAADVYTLLTDRQALREKLDHWAGSLEDSKDAESSLHDFMLRYLCFSLHWTPGFSAELCELGRFQPARVLAGLVNRGALESMLMSWAGSADCQAEQFSALVFKEHYRMSRSRAAPLLPVLSYGCTGSTAQLLPG